MEKEMYVTPEVEVVECYVEKGFASSPPEIPEVPIGGDGEPD